MTGFTSPTFTLSSDIGPDTNMIQHAVTALGGTQPASVDVSSVSRPFTLTFVKPKVYKTLGVPNPVTGVVSNIAMNVWKVIARKGVTPLDGQASRVLPVTLEIKVPAGVDTADAENVRAILSALFGLVWDQSDSIADAVITGVVE